MNILNTPLGIPVKEVLEFNGNATTAVHLKADLLIPDNAPLELKIIHNMHTMRDYNNGTFDHITMVVEVTVDEYQRLIYPKRSILTMDLYRSEAGLTGVYKNNTATKTLYKVMLLTNEDHELFDQSFAGATKDAKSGSTMLINLQLIDYRIYTHKDTCYSTVLGSSKMEDYLYYFMSNRGMFKCSIHPCDNVGSVADYIIPENVGLINLANWLQTQGPGVYNHGINSYYQNGMMYVYPIALLDPHPYRLKIAVMRTGSDVGMGTANTYAVMEDVLYLISSGEVPLHNGEKRLVDERDKLEQIYGNSIKWHDPRYQSDVILETTGGMRYTSRNSNLYGVGDAELKIQKIHTQHTANPYKQRSIINKTLGRIITIPWNSGNIDLIEPGTEVEYSYMSGEDVVTVNGFVEGTIEVLDPVDVRAKKGVMGITVVLRLRIY